MFGEKRAIRKYIQRLPPALSKNYGGGPPYTIAQVKSTVGELGLDPKYIHYAYLMFCTTDALQSKGITDAEISQCTKVLDKVTSGGGSVAGPLTVFLGIGNGDNDGGFGDGGGGGE